MTTILDYYWWTEKYIIDSSRELKNRYPDLDIKVVTMSNRFSEWLSIILSLLSFKKFEISSLYKSKAVDNLWDIEYIKCNNFKELRDQLMNADVIYSKNEILETFILKFFVWYKYITKLIFGCHTPLYYPSYGFLHNLLYWGLFYKFLTSWVDDFHVLNESDNDILISNGYKSVHLIPNPINYKLYDYNFWNYIYKSDLIDVKKYNLVRIGRLTKQKWINYLVELCDYVEKINSSFKSDNIVLHIAWAWELINQIINLKNRYSFIRYHWHIDNCYIPSFLDQMNLYLHTSLRESFWLSIIEANLADIPVIAFNIPGPRNIIHYPNNGQLVNSIEEYCSLLSRIIDQSIIFSNPRKYIISQYNDDVIYKKIYNILTLE